MRHLPLSTLRTFEAAARHQSLVRAASELGLTDSAVSHQLRKLEDALGCELFEKSGRGVALTDAGRIFARSVSTALLAITSTANSLADSRQTGGRVTIACAPMFASKWLARNLAEFYQSHPAIECHIRLADNEQVHNVSDADIGIQFGSGGWKGKWTALLEHVIVGPTCSPALLQRMGRMFSEVSDLRDMVLLHGDDGTEWRRWLAEAGDQNFDAYRRHLYCSDISVAIDLALEGAGVALVSKTLSERNVREGTLLHPFSGRIDANGSWYVMCDGIEFARGPAQIFLHWLLGKFGRVLTTDETDQPPAAVERP